MAQTAAAVSGLGRKRVARVLVRCFCKASLDCREGGGDTVRHPAAGEPPAPAPWAKRAALHQPLPTFAFS